MVNFQMFKLVLEKAEEPEIKLPTSAGWLKSKSIPENIYFFFIDYAKAFDCVDHNKLWKILKEMGKWGYIWINNKLQGVDVVISPLKMRKLRP